MIPALDLWSLAHGFVGFLFGRIKYTRLLFYPIPIVWEFFQYYYQYRPQGLLPGDIWLNSLMDILAGLAGYELARLYWSKSLTNPLWLRISHNTKGILTYFSLVSIITWLMWNDVLLGNTTEMPAAEIALILGAFSPVAAAIIIKNSIYKEEFFINGWSRIFPRNWNYYLINGLFPSMLIAAAVVVVQIT